LSGPWVKPRDAVKGRKFRYPQRTILVRIGVPRKAVYTRHFIFNEYNLRRVIAVRGIRRHIFILGQVDWGSGDSAAVPENRVDIFGNVGGFLIGKPLPRREMRDIAHVINPVRPTVGVPAHSGHARFESMASETIADKFIVALAWRE